jgi:large subunit ribosomal protein L18
MSRKVRKKSNPKDLIRQKKRRKIRAKVSGSAEWPRLAVFRSNSHIYTQLIDDQRGVTLASASTLDAELKGKAKCNIEGAKIIGTLIAKRAQAKKLEKVVFDRGGYNYHGKIKALADAAREGGLTF